MTHWDPIFITCTSQDAAIYYKLYINYDDIHIQNINLQGGATRVTHWDPISITCTTPDAEIYYRLDINYDEAWIVDDEVCVCVWMCVCVCVCVCVS